MKKAKELKRKYSKSDLVMLVQGRVFYTSLLENIADFTALYPFINTAFLTAFLVKIVIAENYITDSENQDDTHVETTAVDVDMENGRNMVQILFSYVEFAFPGNSAVQKEFGMEEYSEVNKFAYKFPHFLERAHSKAAIPAYAAALLTKGWTVTNQTALATLIAKLKTDSETQQDDISDRGSVTQTRIANNNNVWDDMDTISTCSKKVYYDNYAMTQKFLLYPEGERGSIQPVPPVPPIV